MEKFLLYSALALCTVTAVSLTVAFMSLVAKKYTAERTMGIVAFTTAILSFSIYYYLRVVLSGGGFSDERVVFVLLTYIVAFILSILSFIDGHRKSKYLSAL